MKGPGASVNFREFRLKVRPWLLECFILQPQSVLALAIGKAIS